MCKPLKALFFSLIFSPLFVHAQQSAHSSGGDGTTTKGSVAFSIGQVVFSAYTAAAGTEGKGCSSAMNLFK